MFSPRDVIYSQVPIPEATIPTGSMIELPGRGETYVTDTPGPTKNAPAIILLHAVGCTGLLTWFPAIEPLSKRYRVITLDQRWHGRGIHSSRFSLYDCADDVGSLIDRLGLDRPIVAGYSMGSIIAQRVWRQHPEKISGLVLGASTAHFRRTPYERVFHQAVEIAMLASRGISSSRASRSTARVAARALDLDLEPDSIYDWALSEFRATSPWAVGQAVAALGRHHSRPWLRRIDVPTAVVVMRNDKVIPPDRQFALAAMIPGATVHDIDAGHAGCVLESEVFVPAFIEAVNTTHARAKRARKSA